MDDHFTLPYPKFSTKQSEAWVPLAYQLALRSLPIRDIAAKFRCHPQTIRDSDEIMEAIRAGHADHRLAIENALFQDAMLNPMSFEDPMERATIRTVRANALKILKNSIDKKEEFVPAAEQEKLRRLSDAELELELQKFRNSTTG
jgi:hypothetical protein